MGEDRDNDGIQDNTASPWVLFEGAVIYDHVASWQADDRRWLVGIGGRSQMLGQDVLVQLTVCAEARRGRGGIKQRLVLTIQHIAGG